MSLEGDMAGIPYTHYEKMCILHGGETQASVSLKRQV